MSKKRNEKILAAQRQLDLRETVRALQLRVSQLKTALEFYRRQGVFHPYDGSSEIEDYGHRARKELERN